jgi:hypothetical protein
LHRLPLQRAFVAGGAGLADERYCASDEEIRPDLDLANSGLSLFAQLSDAEVVDLLA